MYLTRPQASETKVVRSQEYLLIKKWKSKMTRLAVTTGLSSISTRKCQTSSRETPRLSKTSRLRPFLNLNLTREKPKSTRKNKKNVLAKRWLLITIKPHFIQINISNKASQMTNWASNGNKTPPLLPRLNQGKWLPQQLRTFSNLSKSTMTSTK